MRAHLCVFRLTIDYKGIVWYKTLFWAHKLHHGVGLITATDTSANAPEIHTPYLSQEGQTGGGSQAPNLWINDNKCVFTKHTIKVFVS